jgi:hypothetical protein
MDRARDIDFSEVPFPEFLRFAIAAFGWFHIFSEAISALLPHAATTVDGIVRL